MEQKPICKAEVIHHLMSINLQKFLTKSNDIDSNLQTIVGTKDNKMTVNKQEKKREASATHKFETSVSA